MNDKIVEFGDGFWNIRGTFKIAGFLDIGTQASLVRLKSGRFVMLDSYPLEGAVKDQIMALTDQGRAVEAVINVHPFHTVFVKKSHEQFPNARHIGTARHHERFPELKWEEFTTEDPRLHAQFADDFEFSVPAGVDFISANPKLHFSSVMVFHPSSRTLHVDDTLTYVSVPLVGGLRFHPALAEVLQKRPVAAGEFRKWALWLIERLRDVDHLATAHMKSLGPQSDLSGQVKSALKDAEKILSAHESRHG
jgi:hypothetical protein